MVNPWIAAPTTLKITTQEKKELNLFINASKNLQYNFGLSLNDYRNIPFFNRINNISKSQFFGLQFQPIFDLKPEVSLYDNKTSTRQDRQGLSSQNGYSLQKPKYCKAL